MSGCMAPPLPLSCRIDLVTYIGPKHAALAPFMAIVCSLQAEGVLNLRR